MDEMAVVEMILSPLVGAVFLASAVPKLRRPKSFIRLPRPIVAPAVPVTWWRWWGPYRAASAYGAALGLGITTRVPFGAFYVLCLWCLLSGQPAYAGLLMGTYGVARAIVIFPASWAIARHPGGASGWLCAHHRLLDSQRAQGALSAALLLVGVEVVLASAAPALGIL